MIETMTRLVLAYMDHAFTENYIFTVTKDGMKMACLVPNCKILSSLASYDKSRQSIRFRPNKKQIQMIIASSAQIIPLCTVESFKNEVAMKHPNKDGKMVHYNAGEIAEKMVTEKIFNQHWMKDNAEWWMDGDVTGSDGTAWQIKDESNATFCHMAQFNRNGWTV